jgi:quinol monooxygenase YgiN
MKSILLLLLSVMTLTTSLFRPARADEMPARYVRLAGLEIDPAQLDAYKIALKEEMDASVRLEPGVIGLFAVSEKDSPARIRILELYADEDGYHKHLQVPQREQDLRRIITRHSPELATEPFCQPMRPRSAMSRRCSSRCVGAVSAVSLSTALERGGTITAA